MIIRKPTKKDLKIGLVDLVADGEKKNQITFFRNNYALSSEIDNTLFRDFHFVYALDFWNIIKDFAEIINLYSKDNLKYKNKIKKLINKLEKL